VLLASRCDLPRHLQHTCNALYALRCKHSAGIWKLYTAKLGSPLTGKEAAAAVRRFGSGSMQLVGDRSPLLPAGLRMLDDTTAEVAICEGRYHQVGVMSCVVITVISWCHAVCSRWLCAAG
jgi:hypothetical protein